MKRTGSTQCVKRREVFRTIHSNTFKLLHFGHCLYFLHILQLPSPQAASKLIHMSSICHLGAPCLKQTGCAAFFPECELYFQTHRNVSCRVLWRVPPILLSDMLAGSFLHLKWLLQRRNIEKRWCTSDTSSPPQHQPTCFQACKEVRWDTGSCVYGFDRKQDEREREWLAAKGPRPRFEPRATAARTKPLYMGHATNWAERHPWTVEVSVKDSGHSFCNSPKDVTCFSASHCWQRVTVANIQNGPR